MSTTNQSFVERPSSIPEQDEFEAASYLPDHPRPTPNNTTAKSSNPTSSVKPSRRRDKPQLSCNPCRNRKSRCDRKQPCSNCSSRGQLCTYPSTQHGGGIPSRAPLTSGTLGVQDRLVQLERLVMSLIPPAATSATTSNPASSSNRNQEPENNSNPPSSSQEPTCNYATPENTEAPLDGNSEIGSIRVSASELHYVIGDHWAAILDNIADLKDHFDREEQLKLAESPYSAGGIGMDLPPRPHSPPGHALLLYPIHRSSRAEILASLPPKEAVDRYLSYYFNHLDMASSVVHGPTFLQQYDQFWKDPSSSPITWVALLFSMLSLSARALSLMNVGNEVENQTQLADLYHERTVQCLILGDYTKSGPYVLETMVQYIFIEFGKHLDSGKDIWFLLGLALTLAMRMGYHRDPSHFPGISPLQGEIRRRIWVTVLQGDVLISNQMGMPRMLTDFRCDTAEPRNLLDADFDETMTELPPPRPETEYTRALGLIARRRILVPLGRIVDLTTAVRSCSYADVMRLDDTLNKAAESLPPPLKMKPMAASVTDSPIVIIDRLFIGHMICKGRTMLHRRFLHAKSPSDDEDVFAYSRKTCIDASLASLEIQHIYDEETCPGGQLSLLRWRLSSVQNHHFLTATMILCSVLYHNKGAERAEEIKAALRKSRAIWVRNSSKSREAKKAAETVSIVLARGGDSYGFGDTNMSEDNHHATQGASSDPATHSNSGSGVGVGLIDFDENKVVQYGMGYDESNPFSLSAFPNALPYEHQNTPDFNLDNQTGGAGTGLDGWVTAMDELGMNWNMQ